MWSREKSKEGIEKTCGKGWLCLIDEVYDKLPNDIKISTAYQKWFFLRFDINEESENFEIFLEYIEDKSASTCEICGKLGTQVTIDKWIRTRCKTHSE